MTDGTGEFSAKIDLKQASEGEFQFQISRQRVPDRHEGPILSGNES